MREILFRGKRVDNGEWVEGCVNVMQNGNTYIFRYSKQIAVIPETVGQFTGLTDKNGAKIFEGDVCNVDDLIYEVVFIHSEWRYRIVSKNVYCNPYFASHAGQHCKIIGNIYDNPELMEDK